jgi:hypothetical protein
MTRDNTTLAEDLEALADSGKTLDKDAIRKVAAIIRALQLAAQTSGHVGLGLLSVETQQYIALQAETFGAIARCMDGADK